VTAYDMVRRLPGFTVVDADPDVRGYAAAQGNVLIDGVRPASKRDGIDDVLERIPAHAVERIELIRDGTAGIDLLGFAMVANVVHKPVVETNTAAEAGVLFDADGGTEPLLKGEFGRQWLERALELSLASTAELDDESGDGSIVERAPDGTLLEQAETDTRHVQRVSQGTASWRQPLASGRLQLDASLRDTRDREHGTIATGFPERSEEHLDEDETLQELEFGLRYTRELDDKTRTELRASQQLGWLDVDSRSSEPEGEERFEESTQTGEGIVRMELHHARSSRLSFDASAELARNTLDGDASLLVDGEVVALPGSRVRITEQRAEAAVGAQWQAAAAWRVEGGLELEHSRIRQTGDQALTRSFVYPKPDLALRWQRAPDEHWRLSLSREVGQLAFEDFVASAALDTDVVSAGNAELEPEKTWRGALSWEREFAHDGALVLTYTHDRIDDVVDRVPVEGEDGLFDAPGNIGDGTRDTLALEFGTSLAACGLPNVRLQAGVQWRHSRVRDPTTGERREISEDKPVEGEIEFTHTLAARGIKWGLSVDLAERETEYRFDEVERESTDASWTLFAERRFQRRWRVRAELTDAGGLELEEARQRYDGARGQVPLESRELRSHSMPAQLMITLRRESGG